MGFKKGVFGGSPARARWRLLRTMWSMWTIIASAGLLFYLLFSTPLWLTPQLYAVGLCCFHAWHWAAHQRWLLYPMWKVHMYHHWKVYPPKRFMTKVYQNDKAGRSSLGSIAHDGPLYAGLLGNVAALYAFGFLRPVDVLVALLTYAFVGSFANWLHHTFHIEGHWIERYVYFHDLRALHYTHHQGTAKHNYGFLDFSGDIAGQTMHKPDYSLSNPNRHAEGAALLLGKGDEYCSKVQPGPLPDLQSSGVQECLFSVVCFTIEGLIGAFGMAFGPAKEEPSRGGAGQTTGDAAAAVASRWDFLLFS
jgi:hypothetical protein